MTRPTRSHLALVLLGTGGDGDDTGLVGLDALNVELEALLADVAAAVVNGDADGAGLQAADTGGLDLLEGKALALTQLCVVLERRAADGRAQRLQGARAELGSLGGTGIASALLGAGLVKPDLDTALPVLQQG